MADEPNWQPAEAPPWAKQAEPNWQPAEAPSWAPKEKPAERSVLRRAVEAPIESLKESWHGIKEGFAPSAEQREKERVKLSEPSSIVTAPAHSLARTGSGILSAVGAIPGAILSPAQSLIASGMAGLSGATTEAMTPEGSPRRKTSEEWYQEWMPQVGTAFMGLGRMPGGAGTGKFPMPDPILSKTKKVP